MAKKFKFILMLPDGIEVDSALKIHNHVSWPNYSQAEPVRYKGIFDTYEEAEKYASAFKIYKFTGGGYDSWGDEDDPCYYVSIFDAEDAAARSFDVEPGDMIYPNPDEYRIEAFKLDEETVYKYCLYYNGKLVYDSYEDNELCYESYKEAEEEAEVECREFEIEEEGECPYELETVEILGIRIEELGDFILDHGSLVKYIGKNSNVVIPEGVWRIANEVFRDCENITRVEFPGSMQNVYRGAFSGCTNLETVVLPEGIKNIAAHCFRNCSKLESIQLPKSVEKIYDGAFEGCTNLKEVIILGKATQFEGDEVFSGCDHVALKVVGGSRAKSYAKIHNIPYEIIRP